MALCFVNLRGCLAIMLYAIHGVCNKRVDSNNILSSISEKTSHQQQLLSSLLCSTCSVHDYILHGNNDVALAMYVTVTLVLKVTPITNACVLTSQSGYGSVTASKCTICIF